MKEKPPYKPDKLSPRALAERIAREAQIDAQYADHPSLKQLLERGHIDQESYDRLRQHQAAGPPVRPFADLIAALRAERERQGLSLADVGERAGMDRAAVHKLEIGLNKNPTGETLNRYAAALGKRITWAMVDGVVGKSGPTETKKADRKAATSPKAAAESGRAGSAKRKQPT